MKKALAVAALSVLALTACSEQPQTQPVASESVPAFSTLIHISLHPVEAPVPSQPAVEAPASIPVAVAPVVAVPAPVRHYQVAVPQPKTKPAPVPVTVPTPAPVQSPVPVAIAPAPVVAPVTPVLKPVPTPTPTPYPVPYDPTQSGGSCVHLRCGDPSWGDDLTGPPVTTEPPCVSTDPTQACWFHIIVAPTPEPKGDQK